MTEARARLRGQLSVGDKVSLYDVAGVSYARPDPAGTAEVVGFDSGWVVLSVADAPPVVEAPASVGGVPLVVEEGETFVVPDNVQLVYRYPIKVKGKLRFEGTGRLIEVP